MAYRYKKIKSLKGIIILITGFLLLWPGIKSQVPSFRETVWLQSSRYLYLSGENVLIKASVLEADSYRPSFLSKNLRIELLNADGKRLYYNNFELDSTQMTSIISLPPDLPSGCYYIRAYTNWMLNYPENEYSWLPLKIANPADLNDISYSGENDIIIVRLIPLASRIEDSDKRECIIYTSYKTGEPVSAEGFILSSPEDTVVRILTHRTGWSITDYNPDHIDKYRTYIRGFSPAEINLIVDQTLDNKPLMKISEYNSYIRVEILNLSKTGNYKLLAHRLYTWYWYRLSNTVTGNIVFEIPKSEIPSGILQFSLLDNSNNLICKQLWSDYTDTPISIALNKTENGDNDDSFNARCYIPADITKSQKNNINIIIARSSPGYLPEFYLPGLPGWPADNTIPRKHVAFRAWLLANSYSDNTVNQFFRNSDTPVTPLLIPGNEAVGLHFAETRGGVMSGRVINTETGEGVPFTNIGLTILNDKSFYASTSDKEGTFFFTFPDVNDSRDYIINFIDEAKPEWEIQINPEFSDSRDMLVRKSITLSKEERDFLRTQIILTQLRDLYYPDSIQSNQTNISSKHIGEKAFYGIPDHSILVDDYIDLPNLREVFYEVVPNVNVRKKNGKWTPYITGDFLYQGPYPSLVLFDGIPVNEYDDILNLAPDRIESIKLVNSFYIHGNSIFAGILDIMSRNKDFGGLTLPSGSVLGNIQLPIINKNYDIISCNNTSPGKPVLDNTAVWKNNILDKDCNITFNTGDVPGEYTICIYGYDSGGTWYFGLNKTSKTIE